MPARAWRALHTAKLADDETAMAEPSELYELCFTVSNRWRFKLPAPEEDHDPTFDCVRRSIELGCRRRLTEHEKEDIAAEISGDRPGREGT